jgi:hypothetical protein
VTGEPFPAADKFYPRELSLLFSTGVLHHALTFVFVSGSGLGGSGDGPAKRQG